MRKRRPYPEVPAGRPPRPRYYQLALDEARGWGLGCAPDADPAHALLAVLDADIIWYDWYNDKRLDGGELLRLYVFRISPLAALGWMQAQQPRKQRLSWPEAALRAYSAISRHIEERALDAFPGRGKKVGSARKRARRARGAAPKEAW
jgi:hypothetical protein